MSSTAGRLDRDRVRDSFSRAAAAYDDVAVLQREVGDRLIERLDPIRRQPTQILDLGTGTGHGLRALLRKYPGAQVVAVDVADAMLEQARLQQPWTERYLRRRTRWVCADLHALPFENDAFDLVHSNLTLQWSVDLEVALRELQRVTAPEGAVFFSTFGPRTLFELRESWASVDPHTHVSEFADLHDVGDAMLQAGFRDPVIDGEDFTLTYAQPRDVMRELKTLGARNATEGRPRGLMSPHRLARVEAAYQAAFRQDDRRIPATYEVVYGHGWGMPGVPQRLDSTGEVRIDPSSILRRKR